MRTVRTGSGATAVQVVRYAQRKRVVVKHLGSAHRPEELASLTQTAHTWIEKQNGQTALFPPEKPPAGTLIPVDQCRYLGIRYALAYETMHQVFRSLHLDGLPLLLRDLALIRVVQPASQLESLDLLSTYFGKTYRRADLYRRLPAFVAAQGEVERHLCRLARAQFHFDFSIVFYDVTTLFFESFQEDEFRRIGFSKDPKLNQPQIVIGLIVTREGFPMAYAVFEGNRFEGHPFIPVLRQLKETHHLDPFTVVADAAMLSLDNITQLAENRLSYIVGARLANLAAGQIKAIRESLQQTDQATLRLHTERGDLICDFSQRRSQKDKREMEKQIAKAEKLLGQGQPVQRTKFIKYPSKTKPTLNRALIEKTR